MTTTDLKIDLKPGTLHEGPDYERAAFGQVVISAGDRTLTELVETDGSMRNYQPGPYTSGYHLAEWLVWNWWRLRWEPRSTVNGTPTFKWDMAHRMSDIGEGYAWPNITISCDGFQCDLISERSDERDTPLLSYIGAQLVTVPAAALGRAVDEFVASVLERLADSSIPSTNLQTLWGDLTAERDDPEQTRIRRLEALLGFDPDQADQQFIQCRLQSADSLGRDALDELATGAAADILSARQIMDTTLQAGFEINTHCAVRMDCPLGMQWGQTEAWRIGVAAAKAVRLLADLSDQPITDPRLADMAGMSATAIASDRCTNSMSWVFQETGNPPRIALRQPRKTGRRFDVARLIGDRLFSESEFTPAEPLSPATGSYSYRQKAQRAFAAELLSPWEAVRIMLKDDVSPENQEQVAEHFSVSPLTISTLLANNEGHKSSTNWEETLI